MGERKSGCLITTSTVFLFIAGNTIQVSTYIAAVHAFEAIEPCLAVELKPWNINVVNFQPCPISTNLAKFEGKKAVALSLEYMGVVDRLYQWIVDNLPFQSAAELAPMYADVIESVNPHLTVQSSNFCRQFVKRNQPNKTSIDMLK